MNPQETGQINNADVRSQAKAEIGTEIQKADTVGKKQSLGTKILEKLIEIRTSAEEFIASVLNDEQGQKTQTEDDRRKGIEVLRTIVKAAEVAKEGIKVSNSSEGQAILAELADKNLNAFNASTIEVVLYEYLINGKSIVFDSPPKLSRDFLQAFSVLKNADPAAARFIQEAIISAAGKNKFGAMTKEQAEKYFSIESNKYVDQYGRRMEPTPDEWRRYEDFIREIDEGLRRGIEDKTISGDERRMVHLFKFQHEGEDGSQLNEIFRKMNWDPAKISEYRALREKLVGMGLNVEYVKQFMAGFSRRVDEAQRDFNVENLKKFLDFDSEPGKVKFNRANRQEFQELIQKYYYYALDKIHNDKSKIYDKSIANSQEYHYYFGTLRQIISQACEQLKQYHFSDDQDVRDFLTDKSSRYQATILTNAQIFHDLPLYARDAAASFEKWPEFIGYLFPSELAEVFDEGDRFMQIARDEIAMHIRRKLVANGNKYPPDLFSGEYKESGVRWSLKFEEGLRDSLRDRAAAVGIDLKGENEWKLNRAITYSAGIGLANLIDIEVAATADASPNFEGIHPLMAKLVARHNWTQGRGDPYAGIISKYLLRLDVDLIPEDRNIISRLWRKKSWVPKKFADDVDKNVKIYGAKLLDMMFDKGGTYQELLSMVNIASSLNSRHGWRMRPLRDELKARLSSEEGLSLDDSWKKWKVEDWQKVYDISLDEYGAASLWWFTSSNFERVEMEIKRLYAEEKGIDIADEEWHHIKTKEGLKKEFNFDIGGNKQKINYATLKNYRLDQIRGEAFYRYLRRNPGDFYLLLSQLVPELNQIDYKGKDSLIGAYVFMDEAELRSKMRADGKTNIAIEQALGRRSQLEKRWGSQFKFLQQVNALIKSNVGDGKAFATADDLIKALSFESGTAFEKMMQANDGSREDVKARIKVVMQDSSTTDEQKKAAIKKIRGNGLRRCLTIEDFQDANNDWRSKTAEETFRILFGKKGLINILTNMDADKLDKDGRDQYLTNFGSFDKFGVDNIFYRMAGSWAKKQGDINPFAADMNNFAVYKNMGKVGEDTPKRWLGDANAVAKMIEGVGHLDHHLLEASKSGNFEEIYKIHKTMFDTLKNIIGDDYAWRANYILATVVTKFFYEHDLTRNIPLRYTLLNIPARLLLGNSVSLSKLLTHNRHAYSMDENAARTYFRTLQQIEILPAEGIWSKDLLDKQFDATSTEHFIGDVVPSFGWFIMIFLLWTYIKKALEEAEGKKQ